MVWFSPIPGLIPHIQVQRNICGACPLAKGLHDTTFTSCLRQDAGCQSSSQPAVLAATHAHTISHTESHTLTLTHTHTLTLERHLLHLDLVSPHWRQQSRPNTRLHGHTQTESHSHTHAHTHTHTHVKPRACSRSLFKTGLA